MMTYNEIIRLKEKLANEEISLELAKELYWKNYKKGQKSWHTKDWKGRRNKILKQRCEICDSTDTLTIQHHFHPKPYSDYQKEITRKYTQILKENNSVIDISEFKKHIIANYDYIAIPLCPHCGDNRPIRRVRKTPHYRCAKCKFEFDQPIYKSSEELISIFYLDEEALDVREKCFISKDKWKNSHNLSSIKYWVQREKAKTINEEIISKEAFLVYLTNVLRYLSFEDTITACRRCASYYDLKKMDLCPNCKLHYKGIQYPSCIQCLPEDKRKAVLEMIEFEKELQTIHKELGID